MIKKLMYVVIRVNTGNTTVGKSWKSSTIGFTDVWSLPAIVPSSSGSESRPLLSLRAGNIDELIP
jgi:hypothetical protein